MTKMLNASLYFLALLLGPQTLRVKSHMSSHQTASELVPLALTMLHKTPAPKSAL